jgi:hypothetical protein
MSEASTGFLAKNWFKVFIALAITAVISIYLYQNHRLHSCIDDADRSTLAQWQETCTKLKRNKDCELSQGEAYLIDIERGRNVNFCFRLYSYKNQ